jgi:glycosyltransferase involved in cell wall biosynthesis
MISFSEIPETITAVGAEPTNDTTRPLISVLLIAFNQATVVADAVRGALQQTYSPLEILISDDCSSDDTFEEIRRAVKDYCGPHRIILNRNECNEGISAHLSRLVRMSSGELLVVAAGDDVSLPNRCKVLCDYWLSEGRRPDLIASDLVDLDNAGDVHGRLSPTDLSTYRSFDDWARHRPYVVGAAHAWSRRLFDRFGDMMPGAMAEDQIMTFRAIMSGGARSLREPLVMYRRGGLSRKRCWTTVKEFVERIQLTNRFAIAEVTQLLKDADTAGVGERMRVVLLSKLARENYTNAVFKTPTLARKVLLLVSSSGVKIGFRVRIFLYAACPAIYSPFFAVKRLAARWRERDGKK